MTSRYVNPASILPAQLTAHPISTHALWINPSLLSRATAPARPGDGRTAIDPATPPGISPSTMIAERLPCSDQAPKPCPGSPRRRARRGADECPWVTLRPLIADSRRLVAQRCPVAGWLSVSARDANADAPECGARRGLRSRARWSGGGCEGQVLYHGDLTSARRSLVASHGCPGAPEVAGLPGLVITAEDCRLLRGGSPWPVSGTW